MEFERGIGIEQSYADAHYNLAVLLFVLKRYDEAKHQFEQVDKIKPGYRKTLWFLDKIKNMTQG